MLFLLFQLGTDRYALNTKQVAEVLPLVHLKKIPKAPAGIAGTFNFHGKAVPVVDLSEFALGTPAPARLSTRLIVVHYPDDNREMHLLGLIAEKATETMRRELTDFTVSDVTNNDAPYLGPIAIDARGMIQLVEVEKLLPASLRDLLFREVVESSS